MFFDSCEKVPLNSQIPLSSAVSAKPQTSPNLYAATVFASTKVHACQASRSAVECCSIYETATGIIPRLSSNLVVVIILCCVEQSGVFIDLRFVFGSVQRSSRD